MLDACSKYPFADAARAARDEALSMSVFCRGHPLAPLRPALAASGIVTARDLRRIPSGAKVRVTGLMLIVHMPPVRSGKRIIFITLEDETGLIDAVLFPKAQVDSAKPILTCEVQTLEGRLKRTGKDGRSISIVVDKILGRFTGSLTDVLEKAAGQGALRRTGAVSFPIKASSRSARPFAAAAR
jgi:error-prone DNA polymerase